ncbi:MAG: acyltransferase [Lachnospiraceae bacterium]|nr:acyltransferase [Lachnospiraceae bacterium]
MKQPYKIIHMDKEQTKMLKGIAILMVVIGHIGSFSGLLPFIPLGACGVYIFLFLSGYGLMRSAYEKGLQGYWIKRTRNVYFPYLAVLVFVLILSAITKNGVNASFIKYLFFIDYPFGEYWYLLLQMEWYIVFFLIWNVKLKFLLDLKLILLMMIVSDILIISINMPDRKFVWTFGAFVLGCSIGNYGIQVFSRMCNIYITAGFMAVIAIAMVIKKLPWVEAHELGVADTICQIMIVFCAATLVIIYVGVGIVKWLYGIKTMLLVMGRYSYEIYLTHSVYIEMLKNVAEKPIKEKLLVILVFIGLTFVSTLMLRHFMRQMDKIYHRKAV